MKYAIACAALAIAGCGGGDKGAAEPAQPTEEGVELGERPSERRSAVPSVDGDDDGDDGFEVEGLRGRLDSYDIQRGVQPHSSALSSCFTRASKKQRYLAGSVVFDFRVTRAGEVKRVALKESDLGAWAVESCLLEIARGMSFARPKGGEAEFEVPLEFSGRKPVILWTEDQMTLELEGKLEALAACEGGPSDAWITLYIGRRGQVLSAGFAAQDAEVAPAWAECAAQAITAWTLTDPRGKIAKASFRYAP